MNLNNYVDPNYKGPSLIRGYLKKLKCDKAMIKFLKKFNKRYFVLDLNNYSFYYQEKEVASKSQRFNLAELIRIDPNPRITEICDWKFAFMVFIGKRTFTLHADSVSAHNEWCNGLRACIKPTEKMVISSPGKEPKASELAPPGNENRTEVKSEEEKENPILQKEIEIVKNEVPAARNSHSAQIDNGVKGNGPFKFIPVNLEKNGNVKEAKKKIDEDYEEDEVKVLSGPKNIRKPEDFDQIVPVIYTRERPLPKREFTPIVNREEIKKVKDEEPKPIFQGRATSAVKERIVFNPAGIRDMMNDLDDLGLDKVDVRSGLELRQKISESRQMKTDGFKDIQLPSNSKVNEPRNLGNFGLEPNMAVTESKPQGYFNAEPSELKSSTKKNENKGFFGPEPTENENKPKGYFGSEPKEKKTNIGGLSYRPIINKVKYVEKPEVVPDEGAVKVRNERVARNKPQSSRDYVSKEKKVYKEVFPNSKPQGNDCDWDNWDD